MLKIYLLRTLLLLLFPLYSFAANYLVSGAGSTQVNGKYVQVANMNGKPSYRYSNFISNYTLSWDGSKWKIDSYDAFDPEFSTTYYINASTSNTPPSTGWVKVSGTDPVPTVIEEPKTLSSVKTMFVESSLNDGSVNDTIKISYNKSKGDLLSGSLSENFIASSKATVLRLPVGLTASLIKTSDSTLSFVVKGKVVQHANANDVNNISLVFSPSAFAGNDTIGTVNATWNNWKLNFRQAFTVAATGGDFSSISSAITGVTPYDVLELDAATFTEENIKVHKNVVIAGKGAKKTIVQAHAQKAMASHRVFALTDSATQVIFRDLTIQNGYESIGNAYGAAVIGGSAEFYNCAISHNVAKSSGNALTQAGALYVTNLKLFNCLVNDNQSTNVNDAGECYGGGLFSTGSLLVVNCTFTDNYATKFGGAIASQGSTTIVNTTISNNSTKGTSGGIWIARSTIIINSIVYGNTTSSVSSSDLGREYSSSVVSVNNSIIGKADKLANATGAVFNGTVLNLLTGDPKLAPLANNGGQTSTYALLTGSPAIDASVAYPLLPTHDQRGYAAVGKRDLGAYESSMCTPFEAAFGFDKDSININNALSYELSIGDSHSEYLWSTNETTPTIEVDKDGWYKVTVKDSLQGCTGTDSIKVVFSTVTTSLSSDASSGNEVVYPNPTKGTVYLKSASHKVWISTVYGTQIAEKDLAEGENSIDLANLPKGVYLLQFSSEKNKTQKIILE